MVESTSTFFQPYLSMPVGRKNLLKSLQFEGMHFEEDAVADAHKDTFKWLFEAHATANQAADPPNNTGAAAFVPWIRSPKPLFWITGKAGSGKSTLVKYVFTHPAFREHLQHWAGDCQLIKAKFFIINRAPSDLQKSFPGLLRSLLIQILKASRDFVPIILGSRNRGK